MTVSTEEIVAFIAEHPEGVTTPMVGDRFRLLPQQASRSLGRLAMYGVIKRQYVTCPRRKYAIWRTK